MKIHPQASPSLVTVVQEKPSAFLDRLRMGLRAAGLDPALAESFPVDFSVRMALTWESDFWQANGLLWVEARGGAREYLVELRDLAMRGSTQAIRHHARRLARRAEREVALSHSS